VSLHFAEELESIKIDFGPEVMSHKFQTGYLRIVESLTIKFILPLTLSVNDVTVCLSLSMRNLKDIVLNDLFKHGLGRVSNSPYAAPIVMVRKRDASIRTCVDYQALNEYIVKDYFPLP